MDSGEQEEPVSKPAASSDSETSDSDDEVGQSSSCFVSCDKTKAPEVKGFFHCFDLVDRWGHQRQKEGQTKQRSREEKCHQEEAS